MKDVGDITCLVVDYGTFISLAQTLAKSVKKQYYYSPYESEYRDICSCVIGDGIPGVERLDQFLDPDIIDEIDLFVFPDIGFGGLQKHLRSLGKAVWGSMGASDLELYRTKFLKMLKDVGLPMTGNKVVRGVDKLADALRYEKNKWIKINRYRSDMETWNHIDYDHSVPMLDHMSVAFGGAANEVVFVIQDDIETDVECGYDGWTVDGQYPVASYQGYEKKNELYLGTRCDYDDLPEPVKYVNEKMGPVLAEYGYRNFWATEIRYKDGVPYFIDPTARMPGQTGEQLLETCSNLAEVVWHGANGELIIPEFEHEYAAEATMHYTGFCDDWKVMNIPGSVRQWVKLYHFCMIDGLYHFPKNPSDEVGVVLGVGKTPEEAIDHLKDNLELLKDEPISTDLAGFVDLVEEVKEAEQVGIDFTDEKLPTPEDIHA